MKHVLLFTLGAVPLASPAEMYDAEYQACSQSTTVGIVQCIDQAGQKWDQRLNKAYKALMERSEPRQNAELKKAQRLWIQYRDANCAFYAATGGSIGQIEAYECIRAMTKARTCEFDLVNRGDSEPSAECTAATHPTAPQETVSTPPSSLLAATPAAGAKREGLPITMESTLEGRRRQYSASFLTMYSESPYNKRKPHGNIHTNVHFEQEVSTAGGSAVFGWMEDTGQVVLMTHAKYLPSLTLAATTREVEFNHPLESVAQAPRYLMTCIWQRDDGRIAPAMRLYAERDDANSSAKTRRDHQSVLVSWAAVPASRAEKRFSAHDYCTEVATRETTSAPVWEDTLHK